MSSEQVSIGNSKPNSHLSPNSQHSMTLCCVHNEKRIHVHDTSHEIQEASAQRGLCRSSQKKVTCEEFDHEIVGLDHPKKRARACQIDEDKCESIDIINNDSQDVGGILTTRTNRFNIPRIGIRSIHVMLFMDTDAPQPNFNGCAWAKKLLTSYYLVMASFHNMSCGVRSHLNAIFLRARARVPTSTAVRAMAAWILRGLACPPVSTPALRSPGNSAAGRALHIRMQREWLILQ